MYRLGLWLRKPRNLVWITPALACLLAVLLALAAAWGNAWVPAHYVPDIERSTLESLLGVIASSMLSVTTFSLGIMLSAFSSAANGATPRATELVLGDDGTRVAIASFIAAFIYAVVAQTALGLGYYGRSGRFFLFVFTLVVLAYLVFTLVNWVRTLTQLGRLGNTLAKIETAATEALSAHRRAPLLGAAIQPAQVVGRDLRAESSGYLTHIDLDGLQQLASERRVTVHVRLRPGAFVLRDDVLARVDGAVDDADWPAFRAAFVLGRERSFDQDPRFGLIVLSEVAQRALSPAVNDPGTAIQVMSVLTRLLAEHGKGQSTEPAEVTRPALTVAPLAEVDLLRDGFDPIARDGAGLMEVGIRLQKNLAGLARLGSPALAQAAREQADLALARAEAALAIDADRARLRQVHRDQWSTA